MSATTGKFVWYDVMTTDDKAAASFYGKVIGWEARDSGIPGRSYTILSMGSSMVGGLMPIPAEAAGAQPAWMGYIGVHDVDAHTSRVEQAGGAIHRNPEDIPGVGRFAVVADPQGAVFVLFQAAGSGTEPARTNRLARAARRRYAVRLRLLLRPLWLDEGRSHGYGPHGCLPDVLNGRRMARGRYDDQNA
jgi:predicted enzyme related to lactoylglutathione lyase